MKLKERVFELLKANPEKRFKAREIALWIHGNYPEETNSKLTKSSYLASEADLLSQIVAEIGANRPSWQTKFPQLRTTEGRPRQYYWSIKSDAEEVSAAETPSDPIEPENLENAPSNYKVLEHDLYPMLIDFVASETNAEAMRISESTASNKKGPGANKWLYPDVVAIEALTVGMNKEVVDAVRHSGDRRARLWSFEVKRLLNRSNVREAYFQAVSNSSWASFGYLAAAEIEGADTIKEIQMLYSVHGIGLIEIDMNSPTESVIRIPARERVSIEWLMCSRLADENKDFASFIKKVRQFYQTGDL